MVFPFRLYIGPGAGACYPIKREWGVVAVFDAHGVILGDVEPTCHIVLCGGRGNGLVLGLWIGVGGRSWIRLRVWVGIRIWVGIRVWIGVGVHVGPDRGAFHQIKGEWSGKAILEAKRVIACGIQPSGQIVFGRSGSYALVLRNRIRIRIGVRGGRGIRIGIRIRVCYAGGGLEEGPGNGALVRTIGIGVAARRAAAGPRHAPWRSPNTSERRPDLRSPDRW